MKARVHVMLKNGALEPQGEAVRHALCTFGVGGGNGGHNGLRSIDAHIGKDYYRVRIGIGKPENKQAVANFVLSDFPKKDKEHLEYIIDISSLDCGTSIVKMKNKNE